jgi:hypothetical protein
MWRYGASCCAALFMVLLIPAAAHAQGGSITGIVRDTSGAVLPGVTVEASSPILIEKTRSVVSSGDGVYRIVNLLPGTYTVTATLPGFATYKRDAIEIAGDFTATINIDLRVGTQEETITVTGASPIVDVQSTQRQHVLSSDLVDQLPTGKYVVNLGVLLPGVTASCAAACQSGTAQDTGGSSGDSMSTLLVHGSRYRDTRISFNNFVVASNAGITGTTGPNVEEMQETQIDTSGGDAQSQAGGVRVNFVPKEGGNTFRGSMYLSGTNEHLQSNNLTSDLQARGLTAIGHIKSVYDIAPTFGGPIKKDKLWFFMSYRYNNANNYVANVFQNANKNNPNVWTYAPDLTQPGVTHDPLPMAGGRLTWQASQRNKVAVSFDYRDRCQCTNLGNGGSFGLSPDAAVDFRFRPQHYIIGSWSSPVTNRLLLEAIGYRFIEGWGNRASETAGDPSMIRVVEQNPPASYLGITTYRGSASNSNWTQYPYGSVGANATYVTGAHAFKTGFTAGSGHHDAWTYNNLSGPIVSYRFSNGQPNQFTITNDPTLKMARMRAQIGAFVQDKWTYKRVTLNGGVRFDYLHRDAPDQTLTPSLPYAPTRNTFFPQFDATSYKDLSPRVALAYDVFGNGKTAFKISLNRYLNDLSLFNNVGGTPIQGYQTTAARNWTDSNNNKYPDCDFLNPLAQNLTATGGDICGPFTGASANFGLSVPTSVDDHAVDYGYGHRPYNWEFFTDVQQELIPQKMSIDVDVFRRSYGNFTTTDNPLTTAANYDKFTVTVPNDPALPLAGQTLTFVDPNPSVSSLVTTNQVFLSSHFGQQTEVWKGYDVNAVYRGGHGITVQGGMGAIKETVDNCQVVALVPEAAVPTVTPTGLPPTIGGPLGVPFCHQETPMLLQWKGLATYTVPRIDVLVSGTFQNNPGPQLAATLVVQGGAGTPVATQLGHNLSSGTATVNILAPGSSYGERMTQLDVRFGKVIRFGGTRRLIGSVDIYNILNGNAVLRQTAAYPTAAGQQPWGVPQLVQQARLVKFTLTTNF